MLYLALFSPRFMNNVGVRPESCGLSKSVEIRCINPMAWEWEPSLACVTVTACTKRRQGGGRGVRIHPESYIIEGADTVAHGRRQYLPLNSLSGRTFREQGLTSRHQGEPWNRRGPTATTGTIVAVRRRGKTGAALREWPLGVGLSHSSEESCKGCRYARAAGAKGRAEQGTLWRER